MPIQNREVLLLKLEDTERQDSSPVAATDALEAFDIQANPTESARVIERTIRKPSFGSLKSIHAGSIYSVSCSVELKGSGTAGQAPRGLDAALQIAGLDPTIVASTSVTYAPVSTNIPSATLYHYQDGLLTRVVGVRAQMQLTMNADRGLVAAFTFMGHKVAGDPIDSPLVDPTFDPTAGIPFMGAGFEIDSYSAVINELTIDLGNVLSIRPDVNQDNGFAAIRIVDRNPTGSIDPEMSLVAGYDWFEKWETNAEVALTTGKVGPAVGNQVEVSAPKAQYTGPGFGEREGILTGTQALKFNEDGGDDQLAIAFT